MGLINRCRVCGRNYSPHRLEDAVSVTVRDPEYGRKTEAPLCEKCAGQLLAWLDRKKGELEEPEHEQEQDH